MEFIKELPQNIMSGFSHLATQREDYWDDELNPKYDDPYYVCIVWNNGKKLPLPILLDIPSEVVDEQEQIDEQCGIIAKMASYSGVMEAKKESRDYLNKVVALNPTANNWAVRATQQ